MSTKEWKILLKRGEAHPDTPGAAGQTPLCGAAVGGHAEVVTMLFERDEINPDKSDNDGRIPLSYAAGNGYAEVVEIILKRDDVDPSKRLCAAKHLSGQGSQ